MSLIETITGAPNAAQPLPWLITCGQPGADQLQAAARQGVVAVIDLRDPMENRPFDEPETVAASGAAYVNIPVTLGALDDALLDQILAAVRRYAGQPVMLHCASANRVGGALIPYFILDQGMTEEQAVDAATRVGLRSAELLDWGLQYARARRPA